MKSNNLQSESSCSQLFQVIQITSICGVWETMPLNYWCFTRINGAILNYWPTPCMVGVQGPKRATKQLLQDMRKTFDARRARHGAREPR